MSCNSRFSCWVFSVPRTSRFSLWNWESVHLRRERAGEITYEQTEMEPSNRKHLSPGTEREHKIFPPPNSPNRELKALGLQHLFESLAGEKTCESPQDPERGTKETMERGQFHFFSYWSFVGNPGMSISSLLGGLNILLICKVLQKLLQKTAFLLLPWSGSWLSPWLWIHCCSQSKHTEHYIKRLIFSGSVGELISWPNYTWSHLHSTQPVSRAGFRLHQQYKHYLWPGFLSTGQDSSHSSSAQGPSQMPSLAGSALQGRTQ